MISFISKYKSGLRLNTSGSSIEACGSSAIYKFLDELNMRLFYCLELILVFVYQINI